MKKNTKADPLAERPSLDFSKGVRGKYFNQLQQGTNLVILDPALMPFFPDSASVNKALRAFLEIKASLDTATPSTRPRKKLDLPPAPEIAFDPRTGSRPKQARKHKEAA